MGHITITLAGSLTHADSIVFSSSVGEAGVECGRFDPKTERFESFPLPDSYANVRQLDGRKGDVWGAESAACGAVKKNQPRTMSITVLAPRPTVPLD